MDAKSLAAELGISVQAVNARIRSLGIQPQEVAQGSGRPKRLLTPEQADQVRNYGQQMESQPLEDLESVEGQAAIVAYSALQQSVSMPMGSQMAVLNQTLEMIEDQAALTIAHRVSQTIPRALTKAAHLLGQSPRGFDLADIARGALGVPTMPPSPIPQSLTPTQKRILSDGF